MELKKRGESTTTVNIKELKVSLKNLDAGNDTRDLATLCTDAAELLHAELRWRNSQPYQAPRGTPMQVAHLEVAEATYQTLMKVRPVSHECDSQLAFFPVGRSYFLH